MTFVSDVKEPARCVFVFLIKLSNDTTNMAVALRNDPAELLRKCFGQTRVIHRAEDAVSYGETAADCNNIDGATNDLRRCWPARFYGKD